MTKKLNVIGNRMSILPIALMCGLAAVLSEKHGAGRAAAMGKSFHAMCDGETDALLRLTDEEAQTVMGWNRPAEVDLGDGEVLLYKDAHRELEVGLSPDGAYAEEGDVLSLGHLDMCWVVTLDGGRKRVYVVDIKKSEWTVTEGPESLQLHAYGMAAAQKFGADEYVTGIWAAVEGTYDWGEPVDMMGSELWTRWQKVEAAALNRDGEASTGPHCDGCYARQHCPEYLLPGAELVAGDSALAPYTEPGGITAENAPDLLARYQAGKKLLEQVRKLLEGYAGQNGGIDLGDGKVWRKLTSPGKAATDFAQAGKDAIAKDPGLEQKYTYTTKPRNMGFRTVNR